MLMYIFNNLNLHSGGQRGCEGAAAPGGTGLGLGSGQSEAAFSAFGAAFGLVWYTWPRAAFHPGPPLGVTFLTNYFGIKMP